MQESRAVVEKPHDIYNGIARLSLL